jgi:tRNA threonylcarbamoyladenosine biosynthesis protein TsaE
MLLLRVASLADTHAVSAAIAQLARPWDVIVLAGEMGAGKTAFAQGFGRALGVSEPITSPTFTLVHSYPTSKRLTLHHADLYRLDRTTDIADLALHELAAFDGIVLVEWGDVAGAGLGDHLEVRLTHVDDELDEGPEEDLDAPEDDGEFADNGIREIELHASGGAWSGRWDRLCRSLEDYRC